jgi:methionyl-tRNA synthetase
MEPKKILIAVAWPYVNGDIHLGHLAGYLLPADIEARFQRFIGNDVLMVSGSDCFGTPIALEADKRNLAPATVVEEHHAKNLQLFKDLNLSFDLYTKTDNPVHKEIVQNLFIGLLNKDLIYRDSSEQYYSENEHRFLPDRYVEGTCPHCGFLEARSDQCDNCGRLINMGELQKPISKLTKTPVTIKKSDHYFFAWEKLAHFLETYLADYGSNWREWIYNEAKRWLDNGLKPRAITRDLDWGIEIPFERIPAEKLIEGHEHKRIYVWFEAVIGYLSASIQYAREHDTPELWKEFWHNSDAKHYYFMGKDNLVFHTLFWPGQLHSYDEKLHLPDVQAINQFLTLNNKGFSKSRGVTLDPQKVIAGFGLDVVRFYLTLIMPENSDSDFSWDDFIVKVNNLLIANLGNFIFRTLKLSESVNLSAPHDAKIANEVNAEVTHAFEWVVAVHKNYGL